MLLYKMLLCLERRARLRQLRLYRRQLLCVQLCLLLKAATQMLLLEALDQYLR